MLVLLPHAGLMALNVWTSFRQARSTADLVTDRTLDAAARAIAEDVRVDRGVIDAVVPPVALEMFDTGHRDRVYYRVDTRRRASSRGLSDLPVTSERLKDGIPAHFADTYRGEPLRLAALRYPVVGAGDGERIVVVVGVTLAGHGAMVRELWVGGMVRQLLCWWRRRFSFCLACGGASPSDASARRCARPGPERPHAHLGHCRAERAASAGRSPQRYMGRVEGQMAAQRRFVANAAHQLRTPLALLATQATFARRSGNGVERDQALAGVEESTRRLARLAAQLLTLSRAEPGGRRPRDEVIDLADSTRRVMEGLADFAIERGIDLGLDVLSEQRPQGTAPCCARRS